MIATSGISSSSLKPAFQGQTKTRYRLADALDVLRTAEVLASGSAGGAPQTVADFVARHKFKPGTESAGRERLTRALEAVRSFATQGNTQVLQHSGYAYLAPVLGDLAKHPSQRTQAKRAAKKRTRPKPTGFRVAPLDDDLRTGLPASVARGRVNARGGRVDKRNPWGY